MTRPSSQFTEPTEIIGLAPTVTHSRPDKVSKYAKYDNLLGPSKHLTMKKKKNRVEAYERSTIHTMDELISILIQKKNLNNLSFHIRATIPFSTFNLPFHPSPASVDVLYDNLREKIYESCGIALVLNHTDRAKDNVTRSKRYICRQDSRGDVSKSGRGSNLKQYHCGSRFIFKYKDRYAFVELDLIHRVNHNVNIPVPTLTKAEFTKRNDSMENDTVVATTNVVDPVVVPITNQNPIVYRQTMTAPSFQPQPIPVQYPNGVSYIYPTPVPTYATQTMYPSNDPYLQQQQPQPQFTAVPPPTTQANSVPGFNVHYQLPIQQKQSPPTMPQQMMMRPRMEPLPQYQEIRTTSSMVPQLQKPAILPAVTNINGTMAYAPQQNATQYPMMEVAPTMAPVQNLPRLLPSFDEGFNRPIELRTSQSSQSSSGNDEPTKRKSNFGLDVNDVKRLQHVINTFEVLKNDNTKTEEDYKSYYCSSVNEFGGMLLKLSEGEYSAMRHFMNKTTFAKQMDNLKAILQDYLPEETNTQDTNTDNSQSTINSQKMNPSSQDADPQYGPKFLEHN